MKQLAAFFCFIFFSVNAQDMAYVAPQIDQLSDLKGAKNSKPIGLDLMGGNKSDVTVYPSTDNGHILISVAGKAIEKRSIRIANSNGQPVFKMENRRENTFLVDSSGLRNGIYFIEVTSGNAIYRKKFLKS